MMSKKQRIEKALLASTLEEFLEALGSSTPLDDSFELTPHETNSLDEFYKEN